MQDVHNPILSDAFEKAGNSADLSNISLNYLWINREKFVSPPEGALCGVPLHVLDKAIHNAKKYPQAKVNLWLDNDLLDDSSIAMVASHIYIQGADTIKIRNLRDLSTIRGYRSLLNAERDISQLEGFHSGGDDIGKHNIWGRVDLARLLVVNEALREGDQYAFYADFDIEDVRLDDPQLHRILNKHGMTFGTTRFDSPIFENSYFAFGQGDEATYVLQRMSAGTACMVDKGYNGYESFYQGILEYSYSKGMRLEQAHKDLGFAVVDHRMRYKIPRNDLYIDLGINEA